MEYMEYMAYMEYMIYIYMEYMEYMDTPSGNLLQFSIEAMAHRNSWFTY